ncbi:MAG TPA: hypothetical protein PKN21_00140 [Bacteroidales bacterium]|nr:hypothetical protein [Bacteroidales bacterium]
MKIVFALLVFIHGAIHLMGFAKAFGYGNMEQLTMHISKPLGLLWFLAFVLFMLSGTALLCKAEWWYIPALLAVVLSTVLVIMVWKDAKFATIANVIILAGIILSYATTSYKGRYLSEVKTLLSQEVQSSQQVLTESDLSGLPVPVQKYIRYTGFIGKPVVRNFRVVFEGNIRKNEQSPWMPLTSEQYNFMNSAVRLFFLNATMKGLPVAGFHSFRNGEAFMDIRLLSLIKVQYEKGREMGISETVTFFNDICCLAPGALTDKRIKWLETDSLKVKAEFTNNNITVSAWLYFNEKGELINFVSGNRYAYDEKLGMKQLPWSTPLGDYRMIDGYRLATRAETIYNYPDGPSCYGNFNLKHVTYNTSR